MTRKLRSVPPQPFFRQKQWILTLCWGLGFAYGISLCSADSNFLLSLMRRSIFGDVSIVKLWCLDLLPLLFSAFAVFISAPAMLFLICFCRAVLLGFVSVSMLSAIDLAVCCAVLFSDYGAALCLYRYCFACLRDGSTGIVRWCRLLLLIGLSGVLQYVEYSVLLPLVAN